MAAIDSYLGWKVDFRTPRGEPAYCAPDSVAWRVYKNPIALGVGSWPRSGNLEFEVLSLDAPSNGAGFLGLSFGKLDPALTLLGADAWIDPGLLLVVVGATSDALGYSEVAVPIPASVPPGTKVFTQSLWTPNPCGPEGLSSSNALELTIQ